MSLSNKLKAQAQNLSVLYVEDEKDTNSQISQILKLFFKNVFSVFDGVEALEISEKEDVDLLITDLSMPRMDGLSLIKEIKKYNYIEHIIILTAYSSSDNFGEVSNFKVDGVLLKPVQMDEMLDLLLKVTHMINIKKKKIKCIR